MTPPQLAMADIRAAIPAVDNLGAPRRGGQKVVYPCTIDGAPFALKLMLVGPRIEPEITPDDEYVGTVLDGATARAQREVAIMGECDTPHLVGLGPLPLTQIEIGGQRVIYFTEEWIDGQDLRDILDYGPLPIADLPRLARDVTLGIDALWQRSKVHRDIKPGNIMRRAATGEWVLLDMGLALDLDDLSLTRPGELPGTLLYFSPEQTVLDRKRQLDFRSDLFALGVTLYEAATGKHPFYEPGHSAQQAIAAIVRDRAMPPSVERPQISRTLDGIILRLLCKRPHLRYRSIAHMLAALERVPDVPNEPMAWHRGRRGGLG